MTLKKKIVFSLILIVLFFLVLEGVSAVVVTVLEDGPPREKAHQYHALRDHAHRPNSTLRDDWEGLVTDDYGYIKTPGTPENPDITILLTGSSSARSQQPFTGPDKTLSALIQKKLNEEYGLNVAVKNLAVGGYFTFYEFMTILEYFERYRFKADMVVSLNGLFTMHKFSQRLQKHTDGRLLYPLTDYSAMGEINRYMRGNFGSVVGALSTWAGNLDLNTVRLFDIVSRSVDIGRDKQVRSIDFKNDQEIQYYYTELFRREAMIYEMMDQVSRAHGAEFSLILLPSKYTWSGRAPGEEDQLFLTGRWFVNKFYDEMEKEKPAFSIVDLRESFDGLDTNNSPFSGEEITHYNDVGTQALAEEVVDKILPQVRSLAERALTQ